jgi:hypothetical protein
MNKYHSLVKRYLDMNIDQNTGGLYKHYYIHGLLKKSVSDFKIQDFLSMASSEKIFKYKDNKDIGVFFEEHENEKLPSKEFFMKNIDIPLPAWAKEFQYYVLSQVYADSSCGWSLDLFVSSGKNVSLGTHIDNDDVYTVQLYGTKHWIVDMPDLYRLKKLIDAQLIKRLSSSETWVNNTKQSLDFIDPTIVIMQPGDFLAIPAFALHKVTTLTEEYNLSFNVGIRREYYWRQFLDNF